MRRCVCGFSKLAQKLQKKTYPPHYAFFACGDIISFVNNHFRPYILQQLGALIRSVFFSDSLSSLQTIDSCKVENPLILTILKDHSQLINSGKSITFCWIPSHVGIRGNENADTHRRTGHGSFGGARPNLPEF